MEFEMTLERATAGTWDEAGAESSSDHRNLLWSWSKEQQRRQELEMRLKREQQRWLKLLCLSWREALRRSRRALLDWELARRLECWRLPNCSKLLAIYAMEKRYALRAYFAKVTFYCLAVSFCLARVDGIGLVLTILLDVVTLVITQHWSFCAEYFVILLILGC